MKKNSFEARLKRAEGTPLSVICPTCRAAAGSWCKRPSGHKAMDLHADRIKDFEAGKDTGAAAKTKSFKIKTALLERVRQLAHRERRPIQDQAELLIERGLGLYGPYAKEGGKSAA